MEFPRFKGTAGSEGVNLVSRIVTSELKWIFREQPIDDYGIDAHIELVENQQVMGRLIGVQIKAGPSYLKETTPIGFVYRGKTEHLSYWLNYSLPVILVLCDLEGEICYWEYVTEDKIESTDKGWKIIVPKAQRLFEKSSAKLRSIAMSQGEYSARYNSLVFAKPWLSALQNGHRVIVEAEEWVNKSSAKGSLRIKIIDEASGQERVDQDWPTTYFPMMPYERVFQQLFPWASISVDDDFYYDYEKSGFLDEWGLWDPEDHRYYVSQDFREWRDRKPEIRAYSDDGEVASYRLELALNELGKAFLILDKYLRSDGVIRADTDEREGSDADPTRHF